ncbi:sulfatase [Sphingobium sp. JS3065]|uniref:sulfatase family protein n=1 Tax=Sphingobium sp. JS3065 TaxID=2970925 RepID=UPI002264ECAD|nr:sulfatase [Sphingobium sp. JS3065]UZW57401.1 sulfatase [Sphingobium sp. JS3065]
MSASLAHAATPTRAPNFIVIYCDDLGYGDIGPMGGRDIPTPHLDRMAREGMTLTDYYAPANVCTPSRAGLLTGRYPIRSGMSKVLNTGDTRVMPQSEVTIAKALKPAYTSALIGKWHLGHSGPAWAPTNYGFDLFYGLPYSHDISPLKVYEFDKTGQRGEWEPDFPRLQQQFYTRAERFLEEQQGKPFFLELALSSPHLPNYPAPGFEQKSLHAGAYGDTVMEIDSIVGRLMEKLKRLGLDRDTLVIFSSDNGPWFEGSTGGLRQRKGGAGFDGGYRVPFIARWPGHIPANQRSDAIAMGTDLLPTFCALAGVAPPQGVELDGKDIGPVLLRKAATPHDELVLFQGEEVVGIRTQKWKYVNADLYQDYFILLDKRGYPQLYDMSRPGEQYSVASLHPDILKAMQARLARAVARFNPLRTAPSPLDKQRAGVKERHVPEQWRSE